MSEKVECQNCQGGAIPLGEHFVSVCMCIDAGMDTMHAGQSMGIEWGECSCCNGLYQECENCMELANATTDAG